eukprot:11365795-Prorocentrum_lima.AAC.1
MALRWLNNCKMEQPLRIESREKQLFLVEKERSMVDQAMTLQKQTEDAEEEATSSGAERCQFWNEKQREKRHADFMNMVKGKC